MLNNNVSLLHPVNDKNILANYSNRSSITNKKSDQVSISAHQSVRNHLASINSSMGKIELEASLVATELKVIEKKVMLTDKTTEFEHPQNSNKGVAEAKNAKNQIDNVVSILGQGRNTIGNILNLLI
ncbi:MAG: hypothetical protein K6348_01085 [Deferribacterales bacterium]